jgi:hypothetical protein
MGTISSRDRMLAALRCESTGRAPCCFMQFTALELKCRDQFEMVEQLLAWGLDATVQVPPWLLTVPGDCADLRGLPVRFHPDVQVRESVRQDKGDRYPVLTKEYLTPAGPLTIQVFKTDDYLYGNHVPFLDDFIIPRARKPLITSRHELETLSYLLMPPTSQDVEAFRTFACQAKAFAARHDLLVSGGASAGADMAGWLCGLQPLIYMAFDEPGLVAGLMEMLADWNLARMEAVLDERIDLWVRRGWYENASFWSPPLYRRFILPHLKREVELAHSRGALYGYIMTSGIMPLLDAILEAGVDVLIGVEPLKGDVDLPVIGGRVAGKMALWGGVNAATIVEQGTAEETRDAVNQALDALSPGGSFVLSPVDDVEVVTGRTWDNVQVVIETWKEWRAA